MKYKLRLQQPPNTRGFQRPRTFRVTKGNAIFPSHASDKSTSAFYLYSGRTLFNAGYSPRRRERKREREKKSINRDISHLKQRRKLANVEMIQRLGRNVGHHQSNAIRRPINQWSNQSTVLLDRWNVVVASFNAVVDEYLARKNI